MCVKMIHCAHHFNTLNSGAVNDVTVMSITGMCAGGNTSVLVCYTLLVHSDHLARRSPGLPLPSAPLGWYVEKHNQHTLVTNLFTIDYLTPVAVRHLCLCRRLRRSR